MAGRRIFSGPFTRQTCMIMLKLLLTTKTIKREKCSSSTLKSQLVQPNREKYGAYLLKLSSETIYQMFKKQNKILTHISTTIINKTLESTFTSLPQVSTIILT